MTYSLPSLPYGYSALEPHISAATLKLHHGAHHRGYVDRLNTLIKGSGLEGQPLEEVVKRAKGSVFDNAAQAWNHAFFWKSLRPAAAGGTAPSRLATRHCAELKTLATGFFGSGWVWLVEEAGAVKVVATANADNPLVHGHKPLLVIDVWEHAYYLDRQNRRDLYVSGVVDHLLDWDFAERNLASKETFIVEQAAR